MFYFRFRLYDLYSEDQYIFSLILSMCLESSKTCDEHHLFSNALLPKPKCNWNKDFTITGMNSHVLMFNYPVEHMWSMLLSFYYFFLFSPFCVLSPFLPVSLDCSLLFARLVFSNVYTIIPQIIKLIRYDRLICPIVSSTIKDGGH